MHQFVQNDTLATQVSRQVFSKKEKANYVLTAFHDSPEPLSVSPEICQHDEGETQKTTSN